jgi:hypothetical protein
MFFVYIEYIIHSVGWKKYCEPLGYLLFQKIIG